MAQRKKSRKQTTKRVSPPKRQSVTGHSADRTTKTRQRPPVNSRAPEAEQRHRQTSAILLFALAILLLCIALIPGIHVWLMLHHLVRGLFGVCSLLWPVLLLYVAFSTAFEHQTDTIGMKVGLSAASIILLCGTVTAFGIPSSGNVVSESFGHQLEDVFLACKDGGGAGLVGGLVGIPLAAGLGKPGACIVLLLLLFVVLMLLTGTTLVRLWMGIQKPAKAVGQAVDTARENHMGMIKSKQRCRNRDIDIPLDDEGMPMHPVQTPQPVHEETKPRKLSGFKNALGIGSDKTASKRSVPVPPSAVVEKTIRKDKSNTSPKTSPQEDTSSAQAAEKYMERVKSQEAIQQKSASAVQNTELSQAMQQEKDGYHTPPVSMLEAAAMPDSSAVQQELQTNGQQLVQVLHSFGVSTKIVDISRGPSVTRYELQPAAGVKISKITNLSDDIAMNLAASGVRIEAPIPGKPAVGIEVPNKKKSIVRMRDLVESNAFITAKSKLTVCLGRDIAGAPKVADLAKMPHLLIAGTTGSGKSVCLNSFIISLLYKSTPAEVRFLMIDPKVVELSIYNGIPQLLVPVVTDPRKAAGALSWAVTEMLKRYKIFAEFNVRDIKSYNAVAAQHSFVTEDGQPMEHMPQIVIFIEELADLMMAAPNEVEDSICRLAQMARAAGMHLVIATQRPSVDVVTGLIKANIPSRIALSVSSQVDSRTIIDTSGAEKLLGNGDMLFSPVGAQKPLRVQGAFVSDSEIESIVEFIKKSQEPGYDPEIAEEIEKNAVADKKSEAPAPQDDTDPLLDDAVKCVVEAGQASTSLLQRRLRLGYAHAGRIVDQMEQLGIIGPHEGSKPRKVLITYQQWLEKSMNKQEPAGKEISHAVSENQ
ncbi:MAG: DNA translocase FtsK [Oscillospiraceae bacterium]|nr:DNA translocase FtsK [Oscillospiraceae bacterium]